MKIGYYIYIYIHSIFFSFLFFLRFFICDEEITENNQTDRKL